MANDPAPFSFSHLPSLSPEEVSLFQTLGKDRLLSALDQMLRIRQFETRGEAAYQQGKVGGFYHSYAGQEAIQTAAVNVFGLEHWYITTYRCHALALLLGASAAELMAELFGRETGNARGRGGSMHLYASRLLGGFGIVGGHLSIAAGAAFALKYLKQEGIALCFLGDGAVAQGSFHETLNMAALWDLPVLFVIENNQWGMGTHITRALACGEKIAEHHAPSYGISSYTLNGMNYLACHAGFARIREEILQNRRPILVECLCQRFRGHSISDPGLYRSKEVLQEVLQGDPILLLRHLLTQHGWLSEEEYKKHEGKAREEILAAVRYAEESPWPSPSTLEEGVFAP